MNQFGGNIIQTVDLGHDGFHLLAEQPYFFFHFKGPELFDRFPDVSSLTLFVAKASPGTELMHDGEKHTVKTGDVVHIEKMGKLKIGLKGSETEFFAAGSHQSTGNHRSLKILDADHVKKVTKPWGFELWLNGEHPQYAFKKLFIKSGTKTSLQYHNLKRETMIFCDGEAALHYKKNPTAEIDRVTPSDISAEKIKPGHLVDVMPKHLHRVEAVTDIVLFEVSTPHLDDVIRISDDSNRQNGRISGEHGSR